MPRCLLFRVVCPEPFTENQYKMRKQDDLNLMVPSFNSNITIAKNCLLSAASTAVDSINHKSI